MHQLIVESEGQEFGTLQIGIFFPENKGM